MTSAAESPARGAGKEAVVNRTILYSFRDAARDLWGEKGLQQVRDRVSPETRAGCIDIDLIANERVPETFVLDWYEAAFDGPAQRDFAAYNRFIDRMLDFGFSRVHRFFLGLATPKLLAKRCGATWRHDHSTGDLILVRIERNQAVIQLVDHVYVDSPLSRRSVAEIYRYCVSLTKARNVNETHALLPGKRTLEVVIRWAD